MDRAGNVLPLLILRPISASSQACPSPDVILVKTSTSQLRRGYCGFSFVGPYEANPGAGRISHESPVGKALLGHKAGDQLVVAAPAGVKTYTILGIE
jgi:hypothetical protein